LEHSLIFAMIELGDAGATAQGLRATSPSEQRAALIALDQMHAEGLKAQTVAPLLTSSDLMLRSTAVWVAGHHAEWGNELSGFFKQKLTSKTLAVAESAELKRQLAEFAGSKPIQDIIGSQLLEPKTSPGTRQLLLEAISMSELKEPPQVWIEAVSASLKETNKDLLHAAVAAAHTLSSGKTKTPALAEDLFRLARNPSQPEDLRLEALSAESSEAVAPDSELLGLLCRNLDPSRPVPARSAAANVLARAKLTDEQLITVADRLKVAGPLEVTKVLVAFEQSTNELVGTKLIEGLQASKSRSSLRANDLEKLLGRFPPAVQERGKELLASLDLDTAKQSAHLNELLAELGKGDIRRGQAIFNSPKAACSSCHAMGYLGGHVGPDLTTIGQVRTERDLLESIVYPSASFVRSFEPYMVKTKSDDEYSGVLRRDAPDEIVLVTGPTTEVRIARADILDMRPGSVSLMPAGLDQQLSHQELADLVAFLKATKWGAQ
jgi:putative heme-binding domain-containing protein